MLGTLWVQPSNCYDHLPHSKAILIDFLYSFRMASYFTWARKSTYFLRGYSYSLDFAAQNIVSIFILSILTYQKKKKTRLLIQSWEYLNIYDSLSVYCSYIWVDHQFCFWNLPPINYYYQRFISDFSAKILYVPFFYVYPSKFENRRNNFDWDERYWTIWGDSSYRIPKEVRKNEGKYESEKNVRIKWLHWPVIAITRS